MLEGGSKLWAFLKSDDSIDYGIALGILAFAKNDEYLKNALLEVRSAGV